MTPGVGSVTPGYVKTSFIPVSFKNLVNILELGDKITPKNLSFRRITMNDILSGLALNLVLIREQKEMTRQELSGLAGISEIELEKIETGKVDIELNLLYDLARHLDTDIDCLLDTSAGRCQLKNKINLLLDSCSIVQLNHVLFYTESITSKDTNK